MHLKSEPAYLLDKRLSQKLSIESPAVAELWLPCVALVLTPLWDTYGYRDIPEQRRSSTETTSNSINITTNHLKLWTLNLHHKTYAHTKYCVLNIKINVMWSKNVSM